MKVLDLLKQGCKIEFEGKLYLKGDPQNGYIDVGNQFGHMGCWLLTEAGLKDAFVDIKKIAASDGQALDGSSLGEEV